MRIVKMSTKGQIVIPAELRAELGFKAGSEVSVRREGEELVLHLVPEDPIEALSGKYAGGPSLSDQLMRERAEEDARRDAALG